MKRILLISYNFYPELTGIGKYNGEMIDWLVKSGYDCHVLTAYPYYPSWKVEKPYDKRRFLYSTEEQKIPGSSGRLRVYRCPLYVPENPTGFKRMLLDFSFLITAFFRLLALLFVKKFDLVIAVAPSFQVGLLGIIYKSLRGAKLLYHIQDLQIEAARDLKLIKSKLVINTLLKTERHILKHSDLVTSISEEMAGKIKAKSGKNILVFPNWTDTQQFFPIHDRCSLKREFGFSELHKVILYSGAIGEKQGLESILHAAAANRHNKQLQFVICGSGPYKEKLMEASRQLQLSNVHFFPLQPHEKFNRFLNIADLHLVLQKASASDLVMPSKLGTILAVGGVALITANEGTSLYSLVKKNNIGLVVNASDQKALNVAIDQVLSDNYQSVSKNARDYAVNFLSIDTVMSHFERIFNSVLREESSLIEWQQPAGSENSVIQDLSMIRSLPEAVDDGIARR